MAAVPPSSANTRIGQPPRHARYAPTDKAAAKAAQPIQNTALAMGGTSAGLKMRSVPMRASKYSLNASTPITESVTPPSPIQNAVASKRVENENAHAAPRR